MAVAETCSCKKPMVLLGSLPNGKEAWACPSCDVPEQPVKDTKTIIDFAEENNE